MTDYQKVVRGLTKIYDDEIGDGWWESGEFLVGVSEQNCTRHHVQVYRGTALLGYFDIEGNRFQERIGVIIKRSLAAKPLTTESGKQRKSPELKK